MRLYWKGKFVVVVTRVNEDTGEVETITKQHDDLERAQRHAKLAAQENEQSVVSLFLPPNNPAYANDDYEGPVHDPSAGLMVNTVYSRPLDLSITGWFAGGEGSRLPTRHEGRRHVAERHEARKPGAVPERLAGWFGAHEATRHG